MKQLKVLYFEDRDEDAGLITYNLRKVAVVQHCSHRAEFERVLMEPFDLILIDFNLKDITGEEAIQMAKRTQPATPLILLTGSLGDDDAAAVTVKHSLSCHFLKDRIQGLPKAVQTAYEVRNMKALSERTDRLENLGTLSVGMVHDMNNVLQTVLSGTELLRRNPMDTRTLDRMEQASKRGAQMIDQILKFARGSNGGAYKPVSVEYLFTELGQILRSGAFPNIRSTIKINPGTSKVLCDETQIIQIGLNLIVNSRDAMPHGGEIWLTAQNVREVDREKFSLDGNFVCLTFKDTGSGIPEGSLPHIFDAFYSTKAIGSGTGMGLAIVKRIVDSHGGVIDVESDSAGTTFNIYLLTADNGNTPNTRPHSGFNGTGKTVLVAEDEETLRLYMQLQLEGVGYKVITAANGAEALHYFRIGWHVDVILSDWQMPVLGADKLIENLRAMGVALPPVVVITGSDASAITCASRVLQKPFNEQELLETLDAVLKGVLI